MWPSSPLINRRMCQKLRPSNIFESTFRRSMNFLLRYFTRATYFSKSTSASVKVSSRPDLSTNVSIFSFQPAMLEDDARYKVDLNYPILFVSFPLFVKERKKRKIYIFRSYISDVKIGKLVKIETDRFNCFTLELSKLEVISGCHWSY